MLADVGSVLVGLALAAAAYAVFATLWAMQRRDPRWAESAHTSVYAAAGLLALALLLLLGAFLGDQFQIRYVAYHSSRALPPYLKAAAVWAGQEGSLLLWTFFQALCAALFTASAARRSPERARPLFPWATALLSLLTTFFIAVTLFLSNPFARSAPVPADGYGLNPLLRHPGMIFHPPTLYLGYVGLMVPFALALAALITRRVDDWPAAAHPWALAAWLFLGLGLVLGARWAYDVLDWGGYWGWDAVENAGLLPWLTAIALLHGVVMQGERQGFRTWNLLLAVLSAVLVFAGILITRSGWIRSVHAFAPSALGYYFLAIILLTLAGSSFLLYSRRAVLAAPAPSERLFSRGGMFLLTLILLLTITGSVLAGTLLPTLTGGRFEADPAWFDRVTGPQFTALVLLMGVCPLVGRTVGALQGLRRWGLPAVLGAVLLTVAAALAGFTRAVSLAGFAILGLAGSTTLAKVGRQALARSRQEGERPLYALWHLFARHRRRYGGTLVHVGVILMSLGIIGTRTYAYETEARLWPGEPVEVGDYVLLYEDVRQEPAGDRLSTRVSLAVYRKGVYLTTLYPRLDQYTDSDQTVTVPALRMGLREDLHVALFWSSEDGSVNVKIVVNPLVNFLWLGSLALLAGGTVALWPSPAAAHLPVRETRRRRVGTLVGWTIGLVVLIAAGLTMWGTWATTQPAGRPLTGQPVPDFTPDLPTTAYESTEDPADILVTQLHIFVSQSGSRLQVTEYYLAGNSGERTFVGVEDPATGRRVTLPFTLPAGAEGLRFDGAGLGERFLERNGGFADTQPIPPGDATVEVYFGYEMPYSDGQQIERVFAVPVTSIVLVLSGNGVALQGKGVTEMGTLDTRSGPALSYTAGPLVAGEPLVFTLVGQSNDPGP